MKSHTFVRLLFLLFLMVTIVSFAQAGDLPRYLTGGETIHGRSVDLAKAGADTINLMSTHNDPTNGPGEPYYYGDFEDAAGNPDWNGWTHYNRTQETETHWGVSNYNQPDPANHAAWCGDINFAACDTSDIEGGYGASWHDLIEFRQAVPNPGTSSTVTVTATLIHDSEPAYDYTYLSYRYHGQRIADIQSWDDTGTVAVTGSVSYQPLEYMDGTDIAVYFRFQSDGAWDDGDCAFPSAGGCQVDDINVHIVNGAFDANFFEDFEHGGDPADFGIWNATYPDGVGDFAKIWTGLRDLDPCVGNSSPQVAFIDDGVVVLGTGGSKCINWCYGPGGYIVNTTGGMAGPDEHLYNVIESPVMAWPDPKSGTGADYDGILLDFGLYFHEDLTADAPGIFYNWRVRSADTDGSGGNGVQDINDQIFWKREFVNSRLTGYSREGDDVTDLMNPGRDEVQIQLSVEELGWIWGWTGDDGYPAPYFDNVVVKVFPYLGPTMTTWEGYLAQDNFPERETIDYEDLGSHHVRFDMARNISSSQHLNKDPGDSITVIIRPVRAGADFDGDPKLHYLLDRNPVFDPYRSAGLPDQGYVQGWLPYGRWAFDLPDTGFLFPGDVLHYYISATDAIGGVGGTDPQTSIMPADTTGFSTGFGDPLGYDSSFTVHALPSIRENGLDGFEQPGILFINDFDTRNGGENKWYTALSQIGLLVGEDYDVYYVNFPQSSGVGNGIGGRASHLTLADYDEILYTSGDQGVHTISNGDFDNSPGDDVSVLTNWLDLGGKDMFLTGDGLASDLAQAGTNTLAFLENYMGVTWVTKDVRPLIENQTTPLVKVMPGNPVFGGTLQSWIAYAGCPGINTFDGVETSGTAIAMRLAEFTDSQGQAAAYSFSAATLNQVGTSRIISMPVDLMFVSTDPAAAGNDLPGRAQLLRDVLAYFGAVGGGEPSGIEDVPVITFQTSNYPNPFNPSTTIQYSMPKAGHFKLCIYNVRGQLVKTLIDGVRPSGADQAIVWDGSNNLGSSVSSGVYFYEARVESEVKIGKMTLLK